MSSNQASCFRIKYGESLGDRLVLRFPLNNTEVAAAMGREGVSEIPKSVTIGYYRQLEIPQHAWCFMPVKTATARAALTTRIVQMRIASDLYTRLLGPVV